MGTLEGMSRQTITESGSVPDNFLQAEVLDQRYNEISRGGRRGVSTTKRKNRVNKKTKKKKKKKQICSKER